MLTNIDHITQRLKKGQIDLQELLSIRREICAPFRSHPLGFYACTLLSEGARKIRLHFWPRDEVLSQSHDCQIHDHLFEFKSWVFSGSVENIEYKISLDGEDFSVYRTEYRGNVSVLKKTGASCKLSLQQRYTYNAGSCYEVAAGSMHKTIRLGKNPAFTVLATNDFSTRSPIVLGPLDGLDQYIYQREVIDDILVEAMLTRTLTI